MPTQYSSQLILLASSRRCPDSSTKGGTALRPDSGSICARDSSRIPRAMWPAASLRSRFCVASSPSLRSRQEQAIVELALRQPLAIYVHRHSRPRLSPLERAFWVALSRLWPRWRSALVVVRPETVIRWHRHRFRRYWRSISPPLPPGTYQVIAVDPPWLYYDARHTNQAAKHYPTMPTTAIAALPVRSIAANPCLVFMWATSSKLPDALHVMDRWGFHFRGVAFVWAKTAQDGRISPSPRYSAPRRGLLLGDLPLHRRSRLPRSPQPPEPGSRRLSAGRHPSRLNAPLGPLPEQTDSPVSTPSR